MTRREMRTQSSHVATASARSSFEARSSRGVGRFAACKGSAAESVSPISMRHRLPFAHYAAPYAAVLACKSADECSEFCDQAGLCTA